MIWLLSAAFAGGVHSGIPVHGVPGIGEPTFLTPRTGWTATVEGGFVDVFVGRTEADAADWYTRAVGALTVPPESASGLGDACFGDGRALFGFRDGNVAVLVRARDDAYAWAVLLHGAIVDGVPWPEAPRLTARGDGTWFVPGTPVAVRFRGGQSVPFRPGEFRTPPDEVVVWDAYGRPTSVER